MGITITDNGQFISVDFGSHSENFEKRSIEIQRVGNFVTLKDKLFNETLLYTDITTPVFTSSNTMESQLLQWANEGYGCGCDFSISERFAFFISSGTQAIFTTNKFNVTQSTPVYVNGYLTMEGWTATLGTGTITFDSAVPDGSTVVFENPNNIIVERTIQVFSAISGQTAFPTIFTVNQDSKITKTGLKTDYGIDWNIISGVVTFVNAMIGGETIVISK